MFAGWKILLIALWVVLGTTACVNAGELKLADPFGDEMVLQQGMTVPVWGSADPGTQVTVAFAGQTKTALADAQGRWKVELIPLAASSENRTLTITDGGGKLEVKDVLVGEVWICSGQSNMEMGVPSVANAPAECAAANFPAIRLRVISHVTAPLPLTHIDGSPWLVCTPGNIGFSAAGYFFGRDLHRELKVPVGLIQAAWGGQPIQPFTSAAGLRSEPKLKDLSDWVDKVNADYNIAAKAYLDDLPAWKKSARAALADGMALPPAPPVPGHPIAGAQPTAMYNAMIAPWTGFPVRGALWYQGESNHMAHDGALYANRMAALVNGWRKAWGKTDAEFPFYFVQIAPYRYAGSNQPEEIGDFWEAQQTAGQNIPNTGMAHTQDIGDAGNIHPLHKQEVGQRLARLALARTYGSKTQNNAPITDDCGPEFKSLAVSSDHLTVTFDHAKSGLASRDGKPLTDFEIAGEDDVFTPAEAQINGDTVILKSQKVAAPIQVRFAWRDTAEPNLMNGDKLPACTFHAPRVRNLAAGTWVKAAKVSMLNGPAFLDGTKQSIGFCNGGGSFMFGPYHLDPGTIKGMEVIVGVMASGQKMHVRLDAADGPTIGTFEFQPTGSWTEFKSQSIPVKESGGDHSLYFVFEGGAGICNFKQFRFTAEQAK